MSQPLGTAQVALRLGVIGIIVAATAGAFAYDAGWFSPQALTQDRMMARLDEVSGGVHPGFRRNHAKGVCVTGSFSSNGAAAPLSKASVFQAGSIPVVGRFSFGGGMPFQPDKPGATRALAIQFLPADGGEWRIAMINLPVFPVNSARGFYDFLLATSPDPKTGKPNHEKIAALMAAHPETKASLPLVKGRVITSAFDDATYNGLHAFRLVAADGKATPVRWSVVPQQPVQVADPNAKGSPNYMFDDLATKIQKHPVQWTLVLTLGEVGDPTNDASLPWPDARKKVEAGTITFDAIHSEDSDGRCQSVNYDPLILPDGIAPSDDPILGARSAAYAKSFTLRSGEVKPPSAVTPAEVRADEGHS